MIKLLRSLSSCKRGDSELTLEKLFTIGIYALVVLLFLGRIFGIGSDTSFQQKFYAADMGLLLDSVAAVRPDVNIKTTYPFSVVYGANINQGEVAVYSQDATDAKHFWFSEDSGLSYNLQNFQKGSASPDIVFYKNGNKIGVSSEDKSLNGVYCRVRSFSYREPVRPIPSLTTGAIIVDGEIKVGLKALQGQSKSIVVFVNDNEGAKNVGCRLLEEMQKALPSFSKTAIVPISDKGNVSWKSDYARESRPAMAIELTYDGSVDPQDKSKIARAIRGVLS